MSTTFENVVEKIKREANIGSQVWYPDYRDELPDAAVRALVENDMEGFYESGIYEVDICARECAEYDALQAAARADLTEEELEFYELNEWEIIEEVVWAILEADTTDYALELARRTPDARVMVPLIDEDHAEWGSERTGAQVIEALGGGEERIADLLVGEAPTDLGMAYIVADVPVADLYRALGRDDVVFRFTDPEVIYGNPFTGAVWDARFEGVTIETREIMLDGAWGYPLDEVYGGYRCGADVEVVVDGKAA